MGTRMVPSDYSISKKIEENLYSFYNIIAKTSGKTGYCGSDVNWVITKPSYWPNQIYGARFNKNNIEKRIREILETPLIKATKPRWVIGPTSRPKELSVYLEKNGFQLQYECPGTAKAAIKDAKKAGYYIGVLDASKLGESVYRKIGFKEYCRIKYYQWVKSK